LCASSLGKSRVGVLAKDEKKGVVLGRSRAGRIGMVARPDRLSMLARVGDLELGQANGGDCPELGVREAAGKNRLGER